MPYIDSPLPEFQGQGYQEDPQHKNYRTEQKGLQIKTVMALSPLLAMLSIFYP